MAMRKVCYNYSTLKVIIWKPTSYNFGEKEKTGTMRVAQIDIGSVALDAVDNAESRMCDFKVNSKDNPTSIGAI